MSLRTVCNSDGSELQDIMTFAYFLYLYLFISIDGYSIYTEVNQLLSELMILYTILAVFSLHADRVQF